MDLRPFGRANRPVIVGGGIAGLLTALLLAPLPCILLAKAPLGEGAATGWAQGGLAAALGADDTPALHAADTLAAAAGLGDPAVAALVAEAAPQAVADLERFGVRFDRAAGGGYAAGLEAAHGRRRILHAGGGDRAGESILAALVAAVRATPSITLIEGVRAEALLVGADGGVAGLAWRRAGAAGVLAAAGVVLATGGLGGLFAATTNPPEALGDGLDLAARAGAVLRDLEFVQFHPTAIDLGGDPMPLATEALRGEGAVLVDRDGKRLAAALAGGDLAPRDAVARAVFAALAAGSGAFLDARAAIGAAFPRRFPRVHAFCLAAGLDPVRAPIPVRPAAHYHMGGIAVDTRGRSSVARLWAAGEVAATGLHGANRLASNSLLEGAVFARRVAEDLLGRTPLPAAARLALPGARPSLAPPRAVRRIMAAEVGVTRDAAGLAQALAALRALIGCERGARVALMVALAALRREESRGGHFRRDFLHPGGEARHSTLTLAEALRATADLAPPRRTAGGLRG